MWQEIEIKDESSIWPAKLMYKLQNKTKIEKKKCNKEEIK